MILDLPAEIRLRVYHLLLGGTRIVVIPTSPEEDSDDVRTSTSIRMRPMPLSAQLIRTCHTIQDEARAVLLGHNVFDCSQREGLTILTSTIGYKNLALIKHMIIDWEQMQDFAWSLAKEDFRLATSGLQVLELANWRRRAWGDSSFLWKSVRSYERQLCQAAMEICEKHANLNVIAQSTRIPRTAASDVRVRWRFVPSESHLLSTETIVAIAVELDRCKIDATTEAEERTQLRMIDPF